MKNFSQFYEIFFTCYLISSFYRLAKHAAKDSEPYHKRLYPVEITIKIFDIVNLILSTKMGIHNGIKTARFNDLSMIAVCGFRISFPIDS